MRLAAGIIITLGLAILPAAAFADCAGPVGVAGELRYNSPALQWCDGTNWLPVGSSAAAGANGEIQFKSASGFGSESLLTWDVTNKYVLVKGTYFGGAGSTAQGFRITGSGNDIGGMTVWDRDENPATIDDGDATIYWGDNTQDSLRFAFGNSSNAPLIEKMRLTATGNLGIGTTTPTYPVDVNGTVRATNVIYTSDVRLKTNIRTISGLDTILRLRGVSYDFRADGRHATGVIAQEIEPVMPHAVFTAADGTKSVDYIQIIAPMIEAIKELKADNDELRRLVEARRFNR